MFICCDEHQCHGFGKTLDEAYQNYNNYHGDESAENCTFYEAAELKTKVSILLVEQTKITKAKAV